MRSRRRRSARWRNRRRPCSCVQNLEQREQRGNWTTGPLMLRTRRGPHLPLRESDRPRSFHDHARPTAAAARADVPNDLEAFWLPFTPNRAFKKRPRLIARSKDMHYYTPEGREILDATAALWCCNAGHNRAADRRGDPAAGGRTRLLADLPVRPSAGLRARPRASPSSRRPTSTTCSSAIPARRPPTRR